MVYTRPNVYDIAFRRTWLRLLLIQGVLVISAAIIAYLMQGIEFSLALLFGGVASLAGTLVGAWRVRIATDEAAHSTTLGMAEFYKGAVLRFVLVIALLALGMGVLKLPALAVLIGFIVAQTGIFFARPLRAH
ncbi:MAG: ATP synthase subunit I [Gammaproteobacteria bacterium]|nr:ATP synthase subunit I [Gammaproteobacteria bacterium]